MKKRLIGITAAFLVMVCCFVVGGVQMRPIDGAVVKFSYADIKDSCEEGKNVGFAVDAQYMTLLSDLDQSCRLCGIDEDGNLRIPGKGKDPITVYGVIAVVQAKRSENVLISGRLNWDDKGFVQLDSNKIYSGSLELEWLSHVDTDVEVLDVLYQTKYAQYQKGDVEQLEEKYYFVDKRVPKLLSVHGEESAYMIRTINEKTWYPLEEGEVYFVFAIYMYYSEYYPGSLNYRGAQELEGALTPHQYGIYCLSDPEKQAGYYKSEKVMDAGWAYLRATYPDIIEKYAK